MHGLITTIMLHLWDVAAVHPRGVTRYHHVLRHGSRVHVHCLLGVYCFLLRLYYLIVVKILLLFQTAVVTVLN